MVRTEPLIAVPDHISAPINWITLSLCTFLLLLIGSYHFVITFRMMLSNHCHSRRMGKLSILEKLILFLIDWVFCVSAIHMTYTQTHAVSISECRVVIYTTTVSYTAFKMWTYIIVIRRVYTVFSNAVSPVHYTKPVLILWTIVMILWTATNNIINVLTTTVNVDLSGHCVFGWSLLFYGSVIVFEVTAGLIVFYLFAKPLHILAERAKRVCDKKESSLQKLAVKQCILSLIAVFCTLTTLVFCALFGMEQTFAPIDALVSSTAIVLMYAVHRGIFRKLGCISLVERVICDNETTMKINVAENNENLQRMSSERTTDGMAIKVTDRHSAHSGCGTTVE